MIIRQETQRDYGTVYQVVKTAFASAEHSDGTEQDLVNALRESESFLPELSLVAEINGKIAGHILFTRANVGSEEIVVLAPLAVLPDYQRQGVGKALITEGHRIARELGYSYSNVLGSADYYPRFGYRPAEQFGIRAPFAAAPENFMAIRLREDAPPLNGVLQYAKEFGI